uniref:Ig-like domain-containing protein n=1 Tax=Fundulus heteroclitus TaxID=8078 RepID=A0A3Q2PJ53_FUNHE
LKLKPTVRRRALGVALPSAPRSPVFLRLLQDCSVSEGQSISLQRFWPTGEPPPLVMWLHNGQEVSESEDFHLLREENRHTLLIQEVFPEDTGTYSCRAWNQYGEDRTQARLTVEGELRSPVDEAAET